MTTIVKHRRTGNHYILLGITGDSKANPSRFISELFDREKSEVSTATVCDFQGNIFLAQIEELTVLEIDGKKPADLLPEPAYQTNTDVYVEQSDDFDDEELLEEFDEEQDPAPTPTDSGSFIYGQGSTAQSQVEDEEDWI